MNGRLLFAAAMLTGIGELRAGLKRFWSTVDVLAGSGGFLVFRDGCGSAIVGVLSA